MLSLEVHLTLYSMYFALGSISFAMVSITMGG